VKVINLFGSPGSGKSTVAAGVYHLLKSEGYICEFAQEYAKELVWAHAGGVPGETPLAMRDQLSIFAEQNRRLERVRDHVDFVVTDSPLLLSSVYAPENYPESFHRFVLDMFRSYENINFFLERVIPYENFGRLHTEEQSGMIGAAIQNLLKSRQIPFEVLSGGREAPATIVRRLRTHATPILPLSLRSA
jgi:nicotinamide riboside kinase